MAMSFRHFFCVERGAFQAEIRAAGAGRIAGARQPMRQPQGPGEALQGSDDGGLGIDWRVQFIDDEAIQVPKSLLAAVGSGDLLGVLHFGPQRLELFVGLFLRHPAPMQAMPMR